MSSNEKSSSKSLSTNESSIPITRRFHVESGRKLRRRRRIPDLQKYIEQIVKAQNNYGRENRENLIVSDGVKGKHVNTKKVLENEPDKTDSRNQIKTTTTKEKLLLGDPHADRNEQVRDKRNQKPEKRDYTNELNTNPISEIDNFLRKLYPNPYELDQVREFQVLKARENFRNDDKKSLKGFKSLKGSSLYDFHSKDSLISQSDDGKHFVKADMLVDEDFLIQNFDDVISYDSDNYAISNMWESYIRTGVIQLEGATCTTSDQGSRTSKDESRINSLGGKLRSRPVTTENEGRNYNLSNTAISKKRNVSKIGYSERPDMAKPSKNKSDALFTFGKQNSKERKFETMMNSYDSNEINQGDTVEEKSRHSRHVKAEDYEMEENKKIENLKNISKISTKYYKKPTELYQLYNVMDKTTESILHITKRNEKEKVKNLNNSNQESKTDNPTKGRDASSTGSINCSTGSNSSRYLDIISSGEGLHRRKKEHSCYRHIEKTLKNRSSILATFEREKRKFEKGKSIRIKEEEEENEEKPKKKKKDDSALSVNEISTKSKNLDEVLEYMCKCLRKYTNDNNKRSKAKYTDGDVTSSSNVESQKEEVKLSSTKSLTSDHSRSTCCSKSYCPLELIQKKCSRSVWSSETEEARRKLNITHHRRKKVKSRQNLTKHSSVGEKTERALGSLETSTEQVQNSSPPNPQPERPEMPLNGAVCQVVEPQNELGGYNEEQPRELEIARESQPKTANPLPVRYRKQKKNSYQILKDALENEEKLLADNVEVDGKPSKNSFVSSSSSAAVKSNTTKMNPFTLMEEIKQQRSSFVICVSSIPRHLRTGNPTKIPFATSLSISLSNLKKSWDLKKISDSAKRKDLKRFHVEPCIEHLSHQYSYRFEDNMLAILRQTIMIHTIIIVGLVKVHNVATCQDNMFLKTSDAPLRVKVIPPKKSLFVENFNVPIASSSDTRDRRPTQVTDNMILSLQREDGLEDEEEVENEELLLGTGSEEPEDNTVTSDQNISEQCSLTTCELLLSSGNSETQIITNDSSDTQVNLETESDRQKIHDLLVRTYQLQHKLHRYWHKMSRSHTPSSCPLKQKDLSTDLDIMCKSVHSDLFRQISGLNIQSSFPHTENKDSQSGISWLLESNATKETQTNVEHSETQTQVENIDDTASYHPPSSSSSSSSQSLTDEKTESQDLRESSTEAKDTNEKEEETVASPNSENEEDDDRSSIYSFKSSNDISGITEGSNVEDESKTTKSQKPSNKSKLKNSKFLQKIFHELELFRKTVATDKGKEDTDNQEMKPISEKPETKPASEKPETKPTSDDANTTDTTLDKPEENNLVEFKGNRKSPEKALKTVFKGKESTTELTIGLKDVPITNGSNISVEKKKYSDNHTKISISISKEKPEYLKQICYPPRPCFNLERSNLHRTFSSFYLDELRPLISATKLEDDISKSLNDYDKKESNEEEEEEEVEGEEGNEDYKSVVSSISRKSVNLEGREADDKTNWSEPGTVPPKKFTKHRFGTYKKVRLNGDENATRTKKPGCRYKDLEPLKEALTNMQTKMKKLKRNSYFNNSEYYQRALKLAKMSAGFCHSCGSRSVIPEETLGSYKNIFPRRYISRKRFINTCESGANSNSSFYSFRSSSGDLRTNICDLGVKQSSYILRGPTHSAGAIFRDALTDLHIYMDKI